MIRFTYEDFKIGLVLLEGRQYDNHSVPIVFAGTFPDGYTWELLLSCKDNLNIIDLDAVTEGYGHTFTAQELAVTGRYTVQLALFFVPSFFYLCIVGLQNLHG